jgi:GT2 family glycosyltransferase
VVIRRIGVVVVSWNNESLLGDCLQSVRAQTISPNRVKTIVVDNASSDGSVAFVAENFPEVEVMQIGWNSGFSHANNVATRQLFNDETIDAVVLLNSDARIAVDWLDVVCSFAESRPRGATFQSITLDHVNPSVIDSHHLYVTRSLHATQGGTGTHRRGAETSEPVFGVNAAACLYTRAFLSAQPFDDYLDETMGMYLEDVDLATRALMMGWENWFVGGTHATHIGSASTKERAGGFALRQTWRNQPVLLLSNFPARVLLRGLIGLVKHEVGAVRHLRSIGQPELVGEIMRGRLEGLRLIPYALRRRKQLRPLRVLDGDHLWELMRDGTSLR